MEILVRRHFHIETTPLSISEETIDYFNKMSLSFRNWGRKTWNIPGQGCFFMFIMITIIFIIIISYDHMIIIMIYILVFYYEILFRFR